MKSALEMLSEDVEVIDHVPYRFDGKPLFAKYLNETFGRIASTSFGFRQPSCRAYNDNVGIVNAYEMFVGANQGREGPDAPRTNHAGVCQTRR
jgi:hypothetical protein